MLAAGFTVQPVVLQSVVQLGRYCIIPLEEGLDSEYHPSCCGFSAGMRTNFNKYSQGVQVALYVVSVAIAFTCRPLRLSCAPWVYDGKLYYGIQMRHMQEIGFTLFPGSTPGEQVSLLHAVATQRCFCMCCTFHQALWVVLSSCIPSQHR